MMRNTRRQRFAWWLRMMADRISPDTGPRAMTGWSVTIDPIPRRPDGPDVQVEWGMKFRQDGRGAPVWYMAEDYDLVHDDADTEHTVVMWRNITEGRQPWTRRAGGQ